MDAVLTPSLLRSLKLTCLIRPLQVNFRLDEAYKAEFGFYIVRAIAF